MHIALYHNTPSGGAKRAIHEWTRRLAQSHTVDCFTLSTAEHDFCDIRPFVRRHTVTEFRPARLFNRPWGRLNQGRRWQDLGRLARINEQIASDIDAQGYDVVFVHTCRFTWIPSVLSFLDTPSVYYLHEPFGPRFYRVIARPYHTPPGWRSTVDRHDPLIKLYHRRLYAGQRQSAENTHRLLANSRFTQEHIASAFGLSAPVCHYGVATDAFRPLPESGDSDFLLSVGEMSARKGFDFIVESLGRIPRRLRPALRLACNRIEDPERQYIEALARRHEVTLTILTNLSAEELTVQYNRARFFVYAPVMEPFGLTPLEAMACGRAVVAVNEGGVRESVVHQLTGLLTARDPAQFAQAVCYLLENPATAAEYGRNGRARVLAAWTWDQATTQLVQQLEAVAGGSRPSVSPMRRRSQLSIERQRIGE